VQDGANSSTTTVTLASVKLLAAPRGREDSVTAVGKATLPGAAVVVAVRISSIKTAITRAIAETILSMIEQKVGY